MKRLKKLKPAFWDQEHIAGDHPHAGINFARKWKLIVIFTSFMALLPLLVMTLVEFNLTSRLIEDEVKSSMSKNLRSAVASISIFKDTPKAAIDYIRYIKTGEDNDIFVVNTEGTLLTPSVFYGKSGIPNAFNTNLLMDKTGIEDHVAANGKPVIIEYAKIPNSTVFFVLVKTKKSLTDLWFKPRIKLVGYLIVSILLIILSILGMATYLVGRIHTADQKRSIALHHAEYSNKLASIGRLASGVAHEVNNPLAIINQKTGLMIDLLTMREEFPKEDRLIPLANDVLDAVKRCGTITKQLLDFARDMKPNFQPLDIGEVIDQVLIFLESEAKRKSITISMDNKKPIPNFECDRGSLQQIFLNLFNNALAAMEDGGKLNIMVRPETNNKVVIIVSDNGCGIPSTEMNKIFEPFYSSKDDHYSTGLGLSITYGLVKEINGDIRVKSKVGEGTQFTLTLPLITNEVNHGK
ncbi:MAG: GHKL domain-containing protein [Desulfobacteraceae bacterium]|nr:GHKL domain-containing protein [Desulfobacteraceae bacterium]